MALVTGPLLSLTGRKTIARSVVFYRARGLDIARARVIPANPRTALQVANRSKFATAAAATVALAHANRAGLARLAEEQATGNTWFSWQVGAACRLGWLLSDWPLEAPAVIPTLYDPATLAPVAADPAGLFYLDTAAPAAAWLQLESVLCIDAQLTFLAEVIPGNFYRVRWSGEAVGAYQAPEA